MAKFMDVHSGFVGVTEAQLREAHDRDLAIEKEEGVHFERAWLDPESGKVFCLATRHASTEAASLGAPLPGVRVSDGRRRERVRPPAFRSWP